MGNSVITKPERVVFTAFKILLHAEKRTVRIFLRRADQRLNLRQEIGIGRFRFVMKLLIQADNKLAPVVKELCRSAKSQSNRNDHSRLLCFPLF